MLNAKNDFMWQHGRKALTALGLKPLRFNAPLHPSLRKNPRSNSPYDVGHGDGDLRTDWDMDKGRKPWRWRLGQIVADAASAAYRDGDYRYGFRFLYNPTTIQFTSPLTGDFSPTALNDSAGNAIRPSGTMQMELLLNRIPDVTIPVTDYELTNGPKIDPQDLAELQKRGTMYDIDYLYRTVNGLWALNDPADPADNSASATKNRRKDKKEGKEGKNKKDEPAYEGEGLGWPYESGDIGMLLPTSVWLSIGRSMRYYGWIQAISYTHEMFSADMVPMLTRLNLTFQRVLIGSKEEFEALDEASAVARNAEGNYFDVGLAGGTAAGEAVSGGMATAGYPDKQGKESNPEYIWYSLLRAGYSKAAAAGVLGNLEQESGFDPSIIQPNGVGHGIAQWSNGGRYNTGSPNLVDFAKKNGYKWDDLEAQVGFMLLEMKQGWGSFEASRYKKFNDPVEACVYFHDTYEASADSASFVRESRGGDARKWYQKLKDKDLPMSAGSGSASSASGNSLYIVGDSLTVGSAPYIKSRCKKKGIDVNIDALTGRSTQEGALRIDSGRSADVVVIALGTNDLGSPSAVQSAGNKMMNAIGSSTTTYWINVKKKNSDSSSREINKAIEKVAGNYSNLNVIDYFSQVNDSYFAGDGVHLNSQGYKWRAGLYVPNGMGSSNPSGRSGT